MNWIRLITDLLERPLRVGTVLGSRYQITSFIGMGSYGLAYRALDKKTNSLVVVKQQRRRKLTKRKGFLEREAKFLSLINDNAIPQLIDLFIAENRTYLVMQLMDGKNFEDLIFHENQTYNELECLQILLKVLKVVSYFHQRGIIHRDLRLPNILVKHNEVFVIDFGLAVFHDEMEPIPLHLIPVEKRRYREISLASDFFALGHFVLFLLYSGYESNSLIEKSWEEELTLHPDTKRIIRKLLKIEPPYENCRNIIEELESIIGGLKREKNINRKEL